MNNKEAANHFSASKRVKLPNVPSAAARGFSDGVILKPKNGYWDGFTWRYQTAVEVGHLDQNCAPQGSNLIHFSNKCIVDITWK